MKLKKIVFVLFILLITFLLVACPGYDNGRVKSHEKIFTNIDYGSLEWKDSYIISASNYLPQVQVWDSETGKLVKVYDLFVRDPEKNFYSHLWIYGVAEFHGDIWACAYGAGKHVVRIETSTGKMSFIDLDCYPETIVAFNDTEGGKGALWVSTYSDPHLGCAIRRLDSNGKILKECNLYEQEGIYISGVQRMHYMNGKYQLLAGSYNDLYHNNENKGAYWLVDLSASDVGYLEEIPYNIVFPSNFFVSNNIKPIPEEFISTLRFVHQYDSYNNIYCTVNAISSSICHRLLYKVSSLNPVKLEYKNIIYSKADARAMFNVVENNTNIFITGRILHDVPGEESFTGLEMGVYSIDGGKQIKRIRLPRGNQLYQTTRNGKTWFCRDVHDYDESNSTWYLKTKPQIYMLEHSSGKVYKYSHDGSSVELKPEQD